MTASHVASRIKPRSPQKFMIQPNKKPTKNPYSSLPHNFFIKNVLRSKPAIKPIIPHENICHGVHGPCPKKMLDTIAAVAPIINPVSLPNTIAETIMTKEVGCTLGKIENGTRLTAAIAANTATRTISRETNAFLSKRI